MDAESWTSSSWNGTINVISNKYNGSTFFVLLNNVILEKFITDKDSAIFNINKTQKKLSKNIIICGNDNNSNLIIKKYFTEKFYSAKIVNNVSMT